MKIQCPCGTKYTFDVTPEMAQSPVRFVCQNCGLDASEFVNELIRQEFAPAEPAAEPAPAAAPEPIEPPAAEAPPAAKIPSPGTGRLRVSSIKPAADQPAPVAEVFPICVKHPPQRTTHHCLVCQKPICPKCMELFGYLCSPLCKAKAESHGIDVPVYAGQKSVVEARMWRKVTLVGGAMAAVVLGLLGFWFWYAWFGCVPKPMFSVRYTEPAKHGQSAICVSNQLVFLRGDTLARHDIKLKKEIWSGGVIDKKSFAVLAAESIKATQEAIARDYREFGDTARKMPSVESLTAQMEEAVEASLQLFVLGQNIWVAGQDRLVRYDWDTGKAVQEIPLDTYYHGLALQGGELVLTKVNDLHQQVITHISLATGESRVEILGDPVIPPIAAAALKKPPAGAATAARDNKPATAGLPMGKPGADGGKPLDPEKVAEQAQRMSYAAKVALPAVLASGLHQERLIAEMKDEEKNAKPAADPKPRKEPSERFVFIPSKYGYLQLSTEMLEEKFVAHKAMKEPPKKSALDGNVNVSQTLEVANEILNEIQRSRGGDTAVEDQSRYQVTVRCPDRKEVPDWTGEVIGSPSLFPSKTVSVIAAGKSLVVLDRMNKKLWHASLTHEVQGGYHGFGAVDEDDEKRGLGPCVERGDALYVFDQAVLTAFELATGNVRWRLPSVGVTGIFFDDQGMMYVNTTTASPDNVKYARQIDITQKVSAFILKLDPKTGKTLWTAAPGGFISYLSGKYIFLVHAEDADDFEPNPYGFGPDPKSQIYIRRLNPADGRVLWQYHEKRAPLDVKFNNNSIQIVFKKEVQVLKFLSF